MASAHYTRKPRANRIPIIIRQAPVPPLRWQFPHCPGRVPVFAISSAQLLGAESRGGVLLHLPGPAWERTRGNTTFGVLRQSTTPSFFRGWASKDAHQPHLVRCGLDAGL